MFRLSLLSFVAAFALLGLPAQASAHCDTMDGPVVSAARIALQRGDLQPVLKWVKPEAEAELREAFGKTLAAREQGGAAKEVADRFFFETLVRLHRAGEGAPYTGLKPAGSTEKPVAAADLALEQGSPDALGRMLSEHLAAALRERFTRVKEAAAGAEASPEAGRRYVAAYVDYVHFVEAVAGAVHGGGGHQH